MGKIQKKCMSCDKVPNFAYRGQVALYCSLHMKDGMINVNKVNCLCQLCTTRSGYGLPNGKATRCLVHRVAGMVKLGQTKCSVCQQNNATWGLGRSKTHCINCKHDDMTTTHRVRWCHECHSSKAAYSAPSGKEPTHCRSCKKDTMVPTWGRCVLCQQKRSTFGQAGEKATLCGDCRQPGMIDVKNRRCVCGKHVPHFGLPSSTKGTHCSECASLEMIDVRSQKCDFPGCQVRRDRQRGHRYCANHDTEARRKSRVRENKVANAIRGWDLPPWTSWNKQIAGTDKDVCGKYRPDFVWEMPGHVVIAEVDEFQHGPSGYACENKRMLDIWNSYGGMPIIIIRWNPDAFKMGETTRKVSWDKRLQLLRDNLKQHLSGPAPHPFTIHRLFYDNPGSDFVASTVVSGMDTACLPRLLCKLSFVGAKTLSCNPKTWVLNSGSIPIVCIRSQDIHCMTSRWLQ